MKNETQQLALMKVRKAQPYLGGRGLNQIYKALAEGKIPGGVNLGTEENPVWRIKSAVFFRWLETDTPVGAGAE